MDLPVFSDLLSDFLSLFLCVNVARCRWVQSCIRSHSIAVSLSQHSSGKQLFHDVSFHVRQSEVSSRVTICQSFVIQAQ